MKSADGFCTLCGGSGETKHSDPETFAESFRSCGRCWGTGHDREPEEPISEEQANLALEAAIAAAARFGQAVPKPKVMVCPLDEDSEQAQRAIDLIMTQGDAEWDYYLNEWAQGRLLPEFYVEARARILERKIAEMRSSGVPVQDLDKPLPVLNWTRRKKA